MQMRNAARILAIALALGVSGAPVALDYCLMTCQKMATAPLQGEAAGGHPCHHADNSGAIDHLQGGPRPCNHGEGPAGAGAPTTVDARKSAPSIQGSVALLPSELHLESSGHSFRALASGLSPGSSSLISLTVPLRI